MMTSKKVRARSFGAGAFIKRPEPPTDAVAGSSSQSRPQEQQQQQQQEQQQQDTEEIPAPPHFVYDGNQVEVILPAATNTPTHGVGVAGIPSSGETSAPLLAAADEKSGNVEVEFSDGNDGGGDHDDDNNKRVESAVRKDVAADERDSITIDSSSHASSSSGGDDKFSDEDEDGGKAGVCGMNPRSHRAAVVIGLALLAIVGLVIFMARNSIQSKATPVLAVEEAEPLALANKNNVTDVFVRLTPAPVATPIPTSKPTDEPTFGPTRSPTNLPTTNPTDSPSRQPTPRPTDSPTLSPTIHRPPKTYVPGELTLYQNKLILSTGLSSKIIARSGSKVEYTDGSGGYSSRSFHKQPDAAACVHHPDGPEHGWIYTSNSELDDGEGGVGSVSFDASGNVYDYARVLRGTTQNCGGGLTPWGTWISCEEYSDGQIYEVDPSGRRPARKTVLGQSFGGAYESFAYDVRDWSRPRFFYTEDRFDGAVRRYTPHPVAVDEFVPSGDEAFNLLHSSGGTFEYLVFDSASDSGGTFRWSSSISEGRESAEEHFFNVEGIDCRSGRLVFVSKKLREIFILDLDAGTWTKSSTKSGIFDGAPDQVNYMLDYEKRRKLATDPKRPPLLIFTEEGGDRAGIHGRDRDGNYLTIVESMGDWDETAGLAFSPDRRYMYFAFQNEGLLYAIWREDGYQFDGDALDVKYHYVEEE